MTVQNNYLSAFTALIVGAIGSALYAFLAHYIPLAVVGLLVPMALGFSLIFFGYASMKGSGGFRAVVAVIGAVLNIAAAWFVYITLIMDYDSALDIFSGGPVAIYNAMLFFSEMLEYGFGEVTDKDPSLMVGGAWLLFFWGLEALVLAGAVAVGFRAASKKQHVSHEESLADSAKQMKTTVVPMLGAIVLGVFKNFLQLALVVGAVLLGMELFG